MGKIRFKFDANQEHQLVAVTSVLRLFDKLPQGHSEFKLGDEVIPNLMGDETFDEDLLLANLQEVQHFNGLPRNARLDVDDGLPTEGAGEQSWRYPVFTIEMETGTGKTYVYLRTIYELRKRFGFRKFIIVVPSVAIYEGVLKAIDMTGGHFRGLFSNEHLNVIAYDGDQISKLRDFSTSQFLQVMVLTMAAFNKGTNNIYKRTEKLPGEKLPIEYIQETRPILILDESQNYASQKSKEALRALHPLVAIKYSATPGERTGNGGALALRFDNLIHRLTPVDAFRMNLVKRIQVFGVTEKENFNSEFFIALKRINTDLTAVMSLVADDRGRFAEKEFTIRNHDDLAAKTGNEHYRGYRVEEIDRGAGRVLFANGCSASLKGEQGFTLSRQEIFRVQIEETIRQHMRVQRAFLGKGIKVLSLFFIDKVASYTDRDGIVRKLFDETYERLKAEDDFFAKWSAEEVRSAYFAKKKTKEGEVAVDTSGRNEEERKAEKEAFRLIMTDKERLLSFDEKVCFIFAHSALKEGWDNPNVFQICTLRDTASEMRKRQEIGRGMRLCVDQNGERVMDPDINVLTVIANESYEDFCRGLQSEYVEAGDTAPEKPSNARAAPAKRNDAIYEGADFAKFWEKLVQRSQYRIKIDTKAVIDGVVQRFARELIPPPQVLVKKGKFVITHFEIKLLSVSGSRAQVEVSISDTLSQETRARKEFGIRDDLSKILHDSRLKHFKIVEIVADRTEPKVVFSEGGTLARETPIVFDSEAGQRVDERTVVEAKAGYPVPNLIDRTARETTLTRPTIIEMFLSLPDEKKRLIFSNPEGFTARFIHIIKEVLADHVAEKIEYAVDGATATPYDREVLFPPQKRFPQKELLKGSRKSLYDLVQIDSDVEKRFVQNRLNPDDKIVLYFKFPPKFKISIPKIIGNYNPDWGIVRMAENGIGRLELVRETKGTIYPNLLQFTNEKRKIWCAHKHFSELGISYRHVTPDIHNWWEDESQGKLLFLNRVVQDIDERLKFTEYLPVYSLAAAAGKFSEGQDVQEEGWIKADIGRKLDRRMFVARVVGRSMEPTIPDGSYCVFATDVAGTRQGKIVIAQYRGPADPETGGTYTIKRYESEKVATAEDEWRHTRIILEPDNKDFAPIILEPEDGEAVRIIGGYVCTLEQGEGL